MRKILMSAMVSAVLVTQSTATFAATLPTTQGLCNVMPSWTHDWIPCYHK